MKESMRAKDSSMGRVVAARKEYGQPRLHKYGHVKELTSGGGGTGTEGASGMAAKATG